MSKIFILVILSSIKSDKNHFIYFVGVTNRHKATYYFKNVILHKLPENRKKDSYEDRKIYIIMWFKTRSDTSPPEGSFRRDFFT